MARRMVLLTALLTWVAGAAAGQEWKPVEGQLMTRWAKDVTPDKALPEYPRPTMTRKAWQNLNGLWEYAVAARDAQRPAAMQGKILVPFPIESALSGVKKRVDENQRLWYRRTFKTPEAWANDRVLLHFGAVDWEATVWVNGKEMGSHKGGYDRFSFDITDALKKEAGAEQEVVVAVWDPSNTLPDPDPNDGQRAPLSYQPRGKQVKNPSGIYYTPTTGIWQTVWMEPVPAAVSFAGLKVTPDVDGGGVKVNVVLDARNKGLYRTQVEVLDGDKVIAKGAAGELIKVAEPKLWSAESPFLYGLRVSVQEEQAANPIDQVESYFGMRKVSLGKDEKGITRLMLNGKFVFQVGFLDQGFWPDGLYTAPTDEALRYDIEVTKRLGMNLARKHVKVEPERWYYWCDKLGLLVWQDMPSGDRSVPNRRMDQPNREMQRSPEAAANFERELKAMIDGLHNHPSIVMWVVFNEGWGQYDTERLTKWTKQYDPTRWVNCASGWNDFPVGDVIDMHNYPGPGSPTPTDTRAAVLGEFGGLGLPVEGHLWETSRRNWGYQTMSSPERLTRRYVSLLKGVHRLKESAGLSAAVYTQTTDVETEINGLLTYDRAVIKADADTIAAVNLGKDVPTAEFVTVVPTAREAAAKWKYTFENPGSGWHTPEFDVSKWQEGEGGFGTEGTPNATVRTKWDGRDIWIRREVEIPEGTDLAKLELRLHHDEDAEVYINGKTATQVRGFTAEYEELDIAPAARQSLKVGRNLIAVHCRHTQGGQYIDVGLVVVK